MDEGTRGEREGGESTTALSFDPLYTRVQDYRYTRIALSYHLETNVRQNGVEALSFRFFERFSSTPK